MDGNNLEIPTVPIYGLPISKLNMAQTVEYLTQAVAQRKSCQVITANPIMIMTALKRLQYMKVMKQADLIVPDGTGVVWAARYTGSPVAERVAGFDLMHKLLQVGQARNWKVFLLGASAEIITTAYGRLSRQYPGTQFVGHRDGYFTSEQDEEVVEQICAAKPDLLFVARSLDGQEPWIAKYRSRLNVPIMMGVGGSFDVISGKLKRAPLVFQQMRLEWFYRLLQEPRRFRRMLDLPKFALRIMRDKGKVRQH